MFFYLTIFIPSHIGMPEWMDDNNDDDDNHLSNATFEQDGTFTRSATVRQNNDSEPQKTLSQSTSEESSSNSNTVSLTSESFPSLISFLKAPIRQEEIPAVKSEKPIQQVDTAIVNVPTPAEPIRKY